MRFARVQKKFTAKTTQMRTTAMLIGQMSSAYSLLRVRPAGSVMAAATMMSCQPQKWILDSRSEAVRTLHSRWVE